MLGIHGACDVKNYVLRCGIGLAIQHIINNIHPVNNDSLCYVIKPYRQLNNNYTRYPRKIITETNKSNLKASMSWANNKGKRTQPGPGLDRANEAKTNNH